MINKDIEILTKQLNPKFTHINEPLAPYTTLKIGGKVDILYEAHSIPDLINTVKLAKLHDIPITILGRGSNVLISDSGLRGIVIRNLCQGIAIKGSKPIREDHADVSHESVKARWQSDKTKGTFKYEFKDLDYDESDKKRIEVNMESGVDLAFAISFLLDKGVTGLQWYAGIPGTIGGAIYNDIHGGTHFFNEVITKVRTLDKKANPRWLQIGELRFDYDKSRFHETNEIILEVVFNLFKGDAERAKYTAIEWAKRKSIQPRNSPGCAFRNISEAEKTKFNFPTTSTGYIIEHELKMTGFKVGGAAISPAHHNFIVNTGKATAKDYLAVIREMIKRTKDKFGIKLVPEIFLLGFDKKELEDVLA